MVAVSTDECMNCMCSMMNVRRPGSGQPCWDPWEQLLLTAKGVARENKTKTTS